MKLQNIRFSYQLGDGISFIVTSTKKRKLEFLNPTKYGNVKITGTALIMKDIWRVTLRGFKNLNLSWSTRKMGFPGNNNDHRTLQGNKAPKMAEFIFIGRKRACTQYQKQTKSTMDKEEEKFPSHFAVFLQSLKAKIYTFHWFSDFYGCHCQGFSFLGFSEIFYSIFDYIVCILDSQSIRFESVLPIGPGVRRKDK